MATKISSNKCFGMLFMCKYNIIYNTSMHDIDSYTKGGFVEKYEFVSSTLGGTKARFNVYVPPQASAVHRVPILYYLSGLTCTEMNFITKSGAPRFAAQYGIALICPDTSPRGIDIKGDSDHWDFGKGAGFYVTATNEPWRKYYDMYNYIVTELPQALQSIDKFKQIFDFDTVSLFGHSMVC